MMIYFMIKSEDLKPAQEFVKELDREGGSETFVENMKGTDGIKYCLISVPDNGQAYSEGLKKHFNWSTTDPRLKPVDPPDGKYEWGHAHPAGLEANRIKMSDVSEKE
jgi:hypothetical protein